MEWGIEGRGKGGEVGEGEQNAGKTAGRWWELRQGQAQAEMCVKRNRNCLSIHPERRWWWCVVACAGGGVGW